VLSPKRIRAGSPISRALIPAGQSGKCEPDIQADAGKPMPATLFNGVVSDAQVQRLKSIALKDI
jgi:hypothetical protein